MKKRISRQSMMMEIAKTVAKRSTCNRKQVGAVIEKDGRILSLGYAGSPPGQPHCLDEGCLIKEGIEGCARTIHAEINAISWAARNGISLFGSTLHCTVSPCLQCSKALLVAGILEVRYSEKYRDTEGIDFLKNEGNIWVFQMEQ